MCDENYWMLKQNLLFWPLIWNLDMTWWMQGLMVISRLCEKPWLSNEQDFRLLLFKISSPNLCCLNCLKWKRILASSSKENLSIHIIQSHLQQAATIEQYSWSPKGTTLAHLGKALHIRLWWDSKKNSRMRNTKFKKYRALSHQDSQHYFNKKIKKYLIN